MKNLVVFGDSFQTPSYMMLGTHWSEILSIRNNLNLINLAKAGCSTRYVTFQMLHALDIEDSIIIGSHAASPTRVELLTQEHFVDVYDVDITSFENYYVPERSHDAHMSFIKSLNLFTILSDDSVSEEDKNFLMTKIPSGLLMHIDRWAMFYGLSQLKFKNKNFLYLSSLLRQSDLFKGDYLLNFFDSKNIMTASELTFTDYYVDKHATKGFADPGYHTTTASQFAIADRIEKKLKDSGIL